jgi:biotin transport system substrate-specific component
MNYHLNNKLTMDRFFWPRDSTLIKHTLLILSGVLLLAGASQLSIPLYPVPLTFQSATVVLIGMTYGPRKGCYVVLTYLLAGVCGLPVFADFSSGIPVLYSPSLGYLLGFVPAVLLSGFLAQRGWGKNVISSFAAAFLGVSVIFLFGVTALSQFIGWDNAIALGLVPFIISESIKLIAVSCIVPRFWKK